jgi:hypothetical protein
MRVVGSGKVAVSKMLVATYRVGGNICSARGFRNAGEPGESFLETFCALLSRCSEVSCEFPHSSGIHLPTRTRCEGKGLAAVGACLSGGVRWQEDVAGSNPGPLANVFGLRVFFNSFKDWAVAKTPVLGWPMLISTRKVATKYFKLGA